MRCHVGIIFSSPLEADGLLNRLVGRIEIHGDGFVAHEGALNQKAIVVFISDAGQSAAQAAAQRLIAGHSPAWVVSAGFAGSLDASLKGADILMASSIIGLRGDPVTLDLSIAADDLAKTPGVHVGRLLTVDQAVCKATERRELAQQHGALAVDRESLAVAQVCQRESTRFLGIRAISENIDDELPPDIARLLNKPTTARRIGAAAGTIVRRPSALMELWKLRETAWECSGRLGKFLQDVIAQLPVQP